MRRRRRGGKRGAIGSPKARGRGGVCRGDAAGAVGTGETVWGRRGERWRGRVELRYEGLYLVLGVDAMKGRLW
jgi:hypothetical protein